MREIEFRGKAKHNNEWVYGFYSPLIWYPSLTQTPSIKTFKGGDMEINPETLGQYTGVKDKNGTKIFEGDIVKYCIHTKGYEHLDKNYIVEFSFGGFRLRENLFDEFSDYVDNDSVDWDRCEVIGNIYDNPELLEVNNAQN